MGSRRFVIAGLAVAGALSLGSGAFTPSAAEPVLRRVPSPAPPVLTIDRNSQIGLPGVVANQRRTPAMKSLSLTRSADLMGAALDKVVAIDKLVPTKVLLPGKLRDEATGAEMTINGASSLSYEYSILRPHPVEGGPGTDVGAVSVSFIGTAGIPTLITFHLHQHEGVPRPEYKVFAGVNYSVTIPDDGPITVPIVVTPKTTGKHQVTMMGYSSYYWYFTGVEITAMK